MSFYRDSGKEPFSSEECGVLSRLMPHLMVAFQNYWAAQSLHLVSSACRNALDTVTSALFGIESAGCVRRARLYLPANKGGFACRTCCQLAYSSEAEDATGRIWRKQRKLAARLGAEDRTDPHPPRLKGMHVLTYQRVLRRIWACEMWRDEPLYRFMQRTGLLEVR
jgi:hypothetical protein